MNKKQFLGVAYYPEAWAREQIAEDLDQMLEHGISCVRVAEFAWKTMEPAEGRFDFSLFREVVDACRERGIMVIMGTPGATPPLWLSEKYPDIYGLRADNKPRWHGARQDCCYNHTEYLRLATRITEKMAEEFGKDENVIGWQIDNEISSAKDGFFCVCDKCVTAYRGWLSRRFGGDVERYNREVGTGVFSSRIESFEQIYRPYDQWTHPAVKALWREFQRDCSTRYVQMQYDAIKKYTNQPVGTDMMPFFRELSYEDMSERMDIMQFNQYARDNLYNKQVFWSNLWYNAKKKPYWLTETSCCWNGSETSKYMRHPGFVEMNGWMHIASGAASINYWLWRTHYAGHELMHGSVIESNGRARHIKGEVQKLSRDMDACAELINDTAPVCNGLYVMTSTESDSTLEMQPMYNGFRYVDTVTDEFLALSNARLSPAAIPANGDFTDGRVLYTAHVTSLAYYDLSKRILDWVREGGVWVASALTDIRTGNGAKFIKRATGSLEDAADVTIDYTIPAYAPEAKDAPPVKVAGIDGTDLETMPYLFDTLIAGENAEVLASYTVGDYLEGRAAITSTPYGKGRIVVLGFIPTPESLAKIVKDVCAEVGILPFVEASENMTVIERRGAFDAMIAVEREYEMGSMTAPYDCTDLIDGTAYRCGERIAVGKYGVKVLKRA
ncbi:MAG: beta-galactosidase [Clostridia bacterium]|nr:beta-galactosidase [Clostridia bacterium]MBQ9807159.1 beta-galactosidase [Clostridia bacterium]